VSQASASDGRQSSLNVEEPHEGQQVATPAASPSDRPRVGGLQATACSP